MRDELPNPQNLDSFPYKIERGNVPFYVTDLPNRERWMVRLSPPMTLRTL
jgi:hypothetical protein